MSVKLDLIFDQLNTYMERVKRIEEQLPCISVEPCIDIDCLGDIDFEWYIDGSNRVGLTVVRAAGWYWFSVIEGKYEDKVHEDTDVLTEDFLKALQILNNYKE